MENFIKCTLEFDDVEVSALVKSLNRCFDKQQENVLFSHIKNNVQIQL